MAGLTQIGVVSVAFSNTTPQTTATLNTTGAVLLVAVLQLSPFIGSGATVSDSKSNTLTAGTTYTDSSGLRSIRAYRCIAPGTVGASHSWTVTGTGPSPSGFLTVYAYSDTNGAPTLLGESGAAGPNTSQTSLQPGSLTPTANGSVCVTGLTVTGAVTGQAVNSGYTIDTSNTSQFFTASQVQATATAINPTWSWTGSQGDAAVQVVFTPAAGGGGTNVATGVGALTCTGFAPTVAVSNNINVLTGVGSLVLTGFSPTVAANGNVTVATGVGALTLTGFSPTVAVSNNQNVLTGVGALVLTGLAPTVVATGTATQTVITGQPTTCITQRVFTSNVVVAVKDAGGNTVTTDTSPIVLVLVVLSGVAQLYSGTYLRSAVAGVATFNDIAVICSEASTFTIAAVRSGLSTGSSTAITGSVRSNDVTATVT